MTPDLDLAAAAARVGRSYSWLQKHWRTLRHGESGQPFPRPYVGAETGGRPRWTAAAVEAWKMGEAWKAGALASAQAEAGGGPAQREPANDPVPRRPKARAQALIAAAGGAT